MNEITYRQFDFETDYSDVCAWWDKHGWPIIQRECLPVTGFMAEAGETKLCATWIYYTGTQISWMEWLVVNPNASTRLRANAVGGIIDKVKQVAIAAGGPIIFSSMKSNGLIRLMKKKGFMVGDSGMTNLVFQGVN